MAKSKMEERINEMESIRQIETIGVPLVKTIKERKILQLKNQISTVYDLELSLRKLNEHVNFLASIFIGKVGLTISDYQLQNDDHLFDYNSRSEERRVGKECKYWMWTEHYGKKEWNIMCVSKN